MIFDTHAHYDDERFNEDRDSLIEGLGAQNVGHLVNVGASVEGSKASLALAAKYPFIYASVGVHPDDADKMDETLYAEIEQLSFSEKCVAIGEIGLDYYYDSNGRDIQKECFIRQLQIAKRRMLPVIIHSRDAAEDTLEILREFAATPHPEAVIHCFSYSEEMAEIFVSMGFYIGIGGVVTFKNAKKLKEVARIVPLDRILLETDCPYMAPEPRRGTRNDSSLLNYVAETIAELRGDTKEHIVSVTEENAKRFYGISY